MFFDITAANRSYKASKRRKENNVDLLPEKVLKPSRNYLDKDRSNNSQKKSLVSKPKPVLRPHYARRPRAFRALKAFWNDVDTSTSRMRTEDFVYQLEEGDGETMAAVEHRIREYFRYHRIDASWVRIRGDISFIQYLVVRVPLGTIMPPASKVNEYSLRRAAHGAAKETRRLIKATTKHHLHGRLYDVSWKCLSPAGRRMMCWSVLPEWLRTKTEPGTVLKRMKGGGWVTPHGKQYRSPWEYHSYCDKNGVWHEYFRPRCVHLRNSYSERRPTRSSRRGDSNPWL